MREILFKAKTEVSQIILMSFLKRAEVIGNIHDKEADHED